MDTLIILPSYPAEDTKLKAESSKVAGGGPVATGIVAASKLGESAEYIGVLSGDSAGKFLLDDFAKYGVGTENVRIENGYRSFTSVIWLSRDSASRTCVFDRGDLPPLKLDAAKKQIQRPVFNFITHWVSVMSRFTNFLQGLFDYAALLYYISIAGVFLLLTVRVYDKRRWG